MAIDITITIPGDLQTEGSAVRRLKEAIDWMHADGGGPQTAAEYKQFVMDFLVQQLQHEVRRIETAKRKAELVAIEEIEVSAA